MAALEAVPPFRGPCVPKVRVPVPATPKGQAQGPRTEGAAIPITPVVVDTVAGTPPSFQVRVEPR